MISLIINLIVGLVTLFIGLLLSELEFFTRILNPVKEILAKGGIIVGPYYTNEKFFKEALTDCEDHFCLISSDLDFLEGEAWKNFGEFLVSGLVSLNIRGKIVKILITSQNPSAPVVKNRIVKLITYNAKMCPDDEIHEPLQEKEGKYYCPRCKAYKEPLSGNFGLDEVGESIYFHHVDPSLHLACWNGVYSGSMIKLNGRRLIRKYRDNNILRVINDYFRAVERLEETKIMAIKMRSELEGK